MLSIPSLGRAASLLEGKTAARSDFDRRLPPRPPLSRRPTRNPTVMEAEIGHFLLVVAVHEIDPRLDSYRHQFPWERQEQCPYSQKVRRDTIWHEDDA